jgi:HlyD family secretion protein
VDTGKNGKVVNAAANSKEQPVQGVFVLKHDGHKLKVAFVPITTGITGTTDIEVTGGLAADDEIVTGPYKTLRELKSGAQVKPLDANAATTATSTT